MTVSCLSDCACTVDTELLAVLFLGPAGRRASDAVLFACSAGAWFLASSKIVILVFAVVSSAPTVASGLDDKRARKVLEVSDGSIANPILAVLVPCLCARLRFRRWAALRGWAAEPLKSNYNPLVATSGGRHRAVRKPLMAASRRPPSQ